MNEINPINVNADVLNNIKIYQTLIKNGNLYDAKKYNFSWQDEENNIYNKNDFIITAAVVNQLREAIEKNQMDIIQGVKDWFNYNKELNQYSIQNDYSLR